MIKLHFVALTLFALSLSLAANDENAGSGRVAEKISVEYYVYIRLAEDDRWLASSPTEIEVGDRIRYGGGALMKDFYSPTLDRTFESILFVMGIERLDDSTVASEADPHAGLSGVPSSGPTGDPHGSQPAAAIEIMSPAPGVIEPLVGGLTVGEVVDSGESLVGQQVALRARVMKVSLQILGKNWVTLQDGTGTAPDNRLIATTSEKVEVGETVVVKGVVRTDVDIGAGYRYEVVLEEATFSR